MSASKANPKVLIHVGLPKAASSTLQRDLLCKRDLGFVPLNGSEKDAASVDAIDHFVYQNEFTFDAEKSRARFDELIESSAPGNAVTVISQEQLAGNPEKGNYYGKGAADRLKAVFPDAHILIVVREQFSYTLSCYNQRIRSGSNMSLERFIGAAGTATPGYPPILNPEFLEYHHLVEYYQRLFGAEHTTIVPFELVVKDLDAAASRLQADLSLPRMFCESQYWGNKGEGMSTVRLKRFLNTFAGESAAFSKVGYAFTWKPLNGVASIYQRLVPATIQKRQKEKYLKIIKEHYGERFQASNRRLEKMTGLDLGSLGYL